MLKGWRKVPLNDLACVIRRGVSPKYCEDGLLVLNQRCIRDQRLEVSNARRHDCTQRKVHTALILKSGDVLVNSTGVGTLGRVAQVKSISEITTIDSHVTLVRANASEIDLNYFGWAVREKQSFIERLGEGSTGQTELSRNNLAQIEICVPPIPQQKAIADILGTLDDKIALNRQMNQTLEEMAQAIFKSWFIDFDPVHAKAKGQKPVGMNEEIAALFPDSFEESELGMIPKGWVPSPVTKIADFINGAVIRKYQTGASKTLPVVKIAEMNSGFSEKTERADEALPEKFIINDGNILFSWSGTLLVSLWTKGIAAVNQHIFKVIPKTVPRWFIYLKLCADLGKFQRIAAGKATTMGHIQRRHLEETLCAMPPSELLDLVNKSLAPLLARIIENSLQTNSLIELRDILLPKLLSGEISTYEAEKQISQSI